MQAEPDYELEITLPHSNAAETSPLAEIYAYVYPVVESEDRERESQRNPDFPYVMAVHRIVGLVVVNPSPVRNSFHIITYVVSIRNELETGPERIGNRAAENILIVESRHPVYSGIAPV